MICACPYMHSYSKTVVSEEHPNSTQQPNRMERSGPPYNAVTSKEVPTSLQRPTKLPQKWLCCSEVPIVYIYLRVGKAFLHLGSCLKEPHGEQDTHDLAHLEDKQLVHLVPPHVLGGALGLVKDEGWVLLVICGHAVMILHHQRAQQWDPCSSKPQARGSSQNW